LSSLFLIKNIPKEKMEKAIQVAEKLVSWVDRNRAGDVRDDDEETWEDNVVLSESAYKYEFGGLERFHPQKPLNLENLKQEAGKLQPPKIEKVF
jgi:hypothetical protein